MKPPYNLPAKFDYSDILVCAECDTIILRDDVCQSCGDYDYVMRLYVYLDVVHPEKRNIIAQLASV
jgi:RNA polymerase subunit RPABC4/transcription elongation factor Spt4